MKKRIITLLLTLALAVVMVIPTAIPAGGNGATNLIVNGGFEDPIVGGAEPTTYSSEYTWLDPSKTGDWTLGPEYMYTIGTNPSLYHSQWTSFGAHTGSQMMIVNGTWEDYTPGYNAIVWEQTVGTLSCVPTYPVTTYKLFADNGAWEAGQVLVKTNADGQICVKFKLTDAAAIADGWLITEAHVAIAADVTGIPQKNGNPTPGQFPISVKINPGVTETDWYCLAWTGGPVVIAAHAKLEHAAVLDPYEPYDAETGWGYKCGEFPGKNWATYICYTPTTGCDYGSYLLEFWAANSFPGNPTWPAQPAILEVSINDVVVGTLTLEYNPPYAPTPGWLKFSYTWTASSATGPNIKIRDTRHIMYGDDFCIDDISFVRQ